MTMFPFSTKKESPVVYNFVFRFVHRRIGIYYRVLVHSVDTIPILLPSSWYYQNRNFSNPYDGMVVYLFDATIARQASHSRLSSLFISFHPIRLALITLPPDVQEIRWALFRALRHECWCPRDDRSIAVGYRLLSARFPVRPAQKLEGANNSALL